MTDFILDDISQLILKDKGDRKILEQIKRAAQSGEVISIHERNYVKKLADQYLRKKPIIHEVTKQTPPVEITQDEPQTITKPQWAIPEKRTPIFESKIKNERTTKIAFALGGIALAIILVVGLTQTGIPNFPDTDQPKSSLSNFEIKTDLNSYSSGDIISISGKSDISLGNNIELSITNTVGKTIWQENVKIKETGAFSTLTFAGGTGWENSGEFILLAQHGTKQFQTNFNFKK